MYIKFPVIFRTLFRTNMKESDVNSELTFNCNSANKRISQILSQHIINTFAELGIYNNINRATCEVFYYKELK